MPETKSDRPSIPGAVFGFTEDIDSSPESVAAARPRRKRLDPTERTAASETKARLQDRAGSGSRRKRRERKQRGLPKELRVNQEHLESFDSLHALLQTFHDPLAAGSRLQKHVVAIPVLERRLLRTARITTGQLELADVGVALSLLGNKVLEQELLQLLEDMTELKADLIEKGEL